YRITALEGDVLGASEQPALTTLNERLRDEYGDACARGGARGNQVITKGGMDVEHARPHRAFRRAIGAFAGVRVSPDGRVLSEAEWDAKKHEWPRLPAGGALVRAL